MATEGSPVWEQRFRAPTLTFPSWARDEPDRLVYASNETGAFQVYAWDRNTGSRRRVTDEAIGVMAGLPTLDGAGVVWFADATGDEVGQWMCEPFAGGPARPLVDGVPEAWSAGLALGPTAVVVGTADDDGFAVHVARDGQPAAVVHRHAETVEVSDLDRDGDLVCVAHAEHGDSVHLALRVLDLSGDAVGEQWDGDGSGLQAAAWSPVPGDRRLALVHEREGRSRPGVWDLASGERRDLRIDLPGDVSVADWWPDGSALLLVHTHEGRDWLVGHRLDSGDVFPVLHPVGTISGAGVRPDGTVWFRVAGGGQPPAVLADDGESVIAPEGPRAPEGRPYRSWHFPNPAGEQVHGFLAEPDGPGPHPTVVLAHGGPFWAWSDEFRPDVQAWVDHGFAVALVNYRGSTGYGRAWRDRLIGDPGFPELEDLVAGLDDLVQDGVADPRDVVLSGGSWGGYLTLLGIGLHPDRWRAAVAAVPVADYVAAFEDEAPGLQAFDRTLFGGGPGEVPELYTDRSPITYVDAVITPVLVIAGDNDSRCPIRQVLNYVARLEARGVAHEVYRFDAGHGSMVVDERVRQMRAELRFVLDHAGPTLEQGWGSTKGELDS